MPATQSHALYRFYSATGQLLYVGITHNPAARFGQHQADKPWWHDVAGISVEKHSSRADALAAETRAIQVESPLHNKVRPSLGRRRPPAPTQQTATREIAWLCEACGQPVENGAGYIHINNMEVALAQRAELDFDDRTQGTIAGDDWHEAMQLLESEPRWQIHHSACDPHPDAGDYWFDVAQARTHAHLLQRTAHLMEKSWLPVTDWSAFILRAAGVDA